jgi:hypothetical protein
MNNNADITRKVLDDATKSRNSKNMMTIYNLQDLEQVLPFGRKKLLKLCKEGVLPVVKVGKTYISTPSVIEEWVKDNIGNEFD